MADNSFHQHVINLVEICNFDDMCQLEKQIQQSCIAKEAMYEYNQTHNINVKLN